MRNVFEPNSLELADLGGDTHFVTDIQHRVEQLLRANSATRKGLQQELENFGVRALPGALNAAYAFTHQLDDRRNRVLLSDLLVRLVGTNTAARALLIKSGIVEAPFQSTRITALRALKHLGEIQVTELDQIRGRAWDNAYQNEDYHSALLLYRFLVAQGDTQSCSEMRHLAQATFDEYLDIAPQYLDLALCCAPQQSYDILMETIGKMDRTATEFSKKVYDMSALSVSNLPDILRAAYAIKEGSVGYAHRGLQNLFMGPIRKLFNKSPERIAKVGDLIKAGDLIRQEKQWLKRFFWQCLGSLLKSESVQTYFETQLSDFSDKFTLEAAVQLFYIQRGGRFKLWAIELLETLKKNSPLFYSDAYYKFSIRTRPPKDATGVGQAGPSQIE